MIGEFRPYLGMSFTSPDEAIYPESETNTRYLHARFGLMDQDLTNMAANFLGVFTGSIALYGTELGASG